MSTEQRPKLTVDGDICTVEDETGQKANFPLYRHSPLPSGRKIRLLKHEAGRPPWPLSRLAESNECSLVEHELEDTDRDSLDVSNSPYVAMSYFWGEPVYDAALFIIDQGQRTVLPITQSAWEAVQRVLPAIGRFGKHMWIDQICIDQNLKEEKAQQVALMGEIYRRCWHCMIWLGPSDTNTGAAMKLLRGLEATFKPNERFALDWFQVADLSHAQIRSQLTEKLGQDILPPVTDPGWVEIARLLQRDWFRRLWTFQEAILCYKGDATIVCGGHYISVITFMRGSMLLGSEHSFAGIPHTNGRGTLEQISIVRGYVQNDRKIPLTYLLQNNNLRGCKDARDRIYAMRGLRNEDGPEYEIPVDYKKSAQQLFTETARKIIQVQNSLRICADAPERQHEDGIPDLPSWVPDWTCNRLTVTFESLNQSQYFFGASGSKIHANKENNDMILEIQGKIIDSIAAFVRVDIPDNITEDDRRKRLIDEVLHRLRESLHSRVPKTSAEDLAYTIINTITLGGYPRLRILEDSSLPSDAWSKPVCSDMLSAILDKTRPATGLQRGIDTEQWLHALTRQAAHCAHRRFALCKSYPLGLVPEAASAGDSIAIIHGSTLPFVLRPAENGCYQMLGTCYVHGIMHGERVDWTQGDIFHIC